MLPILSITLILSMMRHYLRYDDDARRAPLMIICYARDNDAIMPRRYFFLMPLLIRCLLSMLMPDDSSRICRDCAMPDDAMP